jgi:mono/diheme cytochrome c family protein
LSALRAAIVMALSLAGSVSLGAQPDAMEIVTPPDEHAKTHSTAVRHLSKPATTYAANCAGCHGDSGRSVGEIPTLINRIGYFARIPDGRAYLVQVPNVAMSAVRDEDLAEMLNWLLKTYSAAQLPSDFRAYTGAEVTELRKVRIVPWVRRKELIQALLAARLIPSSDSLE